MTKWNKIMEYTNKYELKLMISLKKLSILPTKLYNLKPIGKNQVYP